MNEIHANILAAFANGFTTNAAIAASLGMSRTEVGRHLKDMRTAGILAGDGFVGWSVVQAPAVVEPEPAPLPVMLAESESVLPAVAPEAAPEAAPAPIEASRSDLKLGCFTWWDLDQTHITPVKMRQILGAEGMLGSPDDGKISVPDIDPLSAIRRACSAWGEGRSNSKSGTGKFRAEVSQNELGTIYVGILQHCRKGHKEVAWEQVETLAYDTKSETWSNPGLTDTSRSFQKEADDYLKHLDHRWIRPNVIEPEFSGMNAVRLKRGGGFYFISNAHADRLARLKRIICALGTSKLHTVSVDNDADTKDAVSGGVRESVLDQVVEIKATLVEWRESTRKIRTDSRATTLEKLAELVSFAGLYESVLEVTLTDLRGEVQACQDEAMNLLNEKG